MSNDLAKIEYHDLIIAQADRIKEVERERDGYLADRNKFELYLHRTHADWELETAAVEALAAKLAKAMEALREIERHSSHANYILVRFARIALAELEGPNE